MRKLRPVYRDLSIKQLHLDKKTPVHLLGLAKTSPALTQTATSHTTGPLAFSPKYATETIYTQLDSYVTYADGPKC